MGHTDNTDQWVPCLVLEDKPMQKGITTCHLERLPGVFDTSREAMDAAEKAARQRPDAIGCSAKALRPNNNQNH